MKLRQNGACIWCNGHTQRTAVAAQRTRTNGGRVGRWDQRGPFEIGADVFLMKSVEDVDEVVSESLSLSSVRRESRARGR